MPKIYVNGQIIDEAIARIAPSDRGFRFGDGVFETVRIENGRAVLWLKHVERLQAGLDALFIFFDAKSVEAKAKELVDATATKQGFLRIAVSRGVGSRGYMPLPDITPTVVMECLPPDDAVHPPLRLEVSGYEKISPRALPTQYKLTQGLQSTLCKMEADNKQVDDVILLNSRGEVSETSSANLFWFREGTLFTPALETGALAGVVRDVLLELGVVPMEEGHYLLQHMLGAECVCATNVRSLIQPVASIGPAEFNTSHALYKPLNAALQQYIASSHW